MTYSHYDRLTALDAMFLDIEDANVHMHVGAVAIFAAAPLLLSGGGLDMDRILAMSAAALQHTPRFRQKLAYVPLLNTPVWVDDERFNLLYHVRHTALPHPGDIRQLKRLTGRIMSQNLDRGKPLWEMWFVEGLQDARFAVITKVHHCMIDGVSGVDALAALMTVEPQTAAAPVHAWTPRPPPTPVKLLLDELLLRAAFPVEALGVVPRMLRNPSGVVSAARDAVEAVGSAMLSGFKPASPTPLNVDIGPHRRFDWWACDIDTIRAIKRQVGGTLNDVVVAIVAGTLRRYLKDHSLDTGRLEVRAMMPVSIRGVSERGSLGNRISFLMAHLPLAERDPVERLHKVIQTTKELKSSKQIRGAEILEELSDRTFNSLFAQFSRLAAVTRSYNLVVTNVPGPPFPVYLLEAPLQQVYPLVPLFSNQALGIALFSYNGNMYWGFNSDWDAMPDLHDFVDDLATELKALSEAAALLSPPSIEGPARQPRKPAGRKHGGRRGRRRAGRLT